MIIIAIVIIVIVGITIGINLTNVIDQLETDEQKHIAEILSDNEKTTENNLLSSIENQLHKQNKHLATIQTYIGWLLVIAATPVIIGIIVLIAYGSAIINILN